MQYGCLKLVHFSKQSGRLSSTGSGILTFGSHCSANFQPILDCFIPKFKLEYDDLENIKTDRVNAVVFNLNQIKRLKFCWDTRYTEAYQTHEDCGYGYKVVCCYEDKYSKPIQTYRGENAVYKFM